MIYRCNHQFPRILVLWGVHKSSSWRMWQNHSVLQKALQWTPALDTWDSYLHPQHWTHETVICFVDPSNAYMLHCKLITPRSLLSFCSEPQLNILRWLLFSSLSLPNIIPVLEERWIHVHFNIISVCFFLKTVKYTCFWRAN